MIDHCTSWSVFKRKANAIYEELCKLIPDKIFELDLNSEGKPKRGKDDPSSGWVKASQWSNISFVSSLGSFEIYVIKDGNKKSLVWSGISKGPPRKDKFPEAADLVEAVNNALAL